MLDTMRFLSAFTAVLVSFLTLSAQASPSLSGRQSDNGYCNQLLTTCAASPKAASNPWSVRACVFGATCFNGQHPVDDFLSALAAKKGVAVPASANLPRVSQAVFNSISTNGQFITQQNFIDGVFGSLSTTNGPFPDAAFVIDVYQRVVVWTAFCITPQGIPFQNFADYYQLSSTVTPPGCDVGRPTGIGLEESCNIMFDACVAQANSDVTDAWSHLPCVFTATCAVGTVGEDLESVFVGKTGDDFVGPESLQKVQTRLSDTVMSMISTDGKTITLQNYIDGYYGLLSKLGDTFPSSVDRVIAQFGRLQSWTGFATGGIPFKNFADFFQFSAVELPDPNEE
ncbi:hypothetical protein D9619_001294 [Psilocybe cf. subviscida]|uniref:Uncharacterized protein n=1 Tax=Psilocybe cf. subviscida TaxID=2480587 RepID=A0A8H5BE89_9AGAR|nr:hypothetical protein D9619_001294 [Psilocybe cf. subviscida]